LIAFGSPACTTPRRAMESGIKRNNVLEMVVLMELFSPWC
jgi:hypothetical protein